VKQKKENDVTLNARAEKTLLDLPAEKEETPVRPQQMRGRKLNKKEGLG